MGEPRDASNTRGDGQPNMLEKHMDYRLPAPPRKTNTIPKEAKSLYDDLTNEVTMLYVKWIFFRQLFAEEECVDLLNRQTPTFFYFIQQLLLDDVTLSLARLADRPRLRASERASFENLIEKINNGEYDGLVNALKIHLEKLKEKCKPFIDRRNRTIAHRDLSTMLELHCEPLTDISRQMIGDALTEVYEFMNEIEAYLTQSEIDYEHFHFVDDARTVLHLLKLGIQQDEAETHSKSMV